MPNIVSYEREKAVEYAEKYAINGNPAYFDFENYGGNCTNFISQCLYHACQIMNTLHFPYWFYFSSFNRSPSWTSVELFYDFITKNKNLGPFARECQLNELELGDIIQLKFFGTDHFSHSLIVTKLLKNPPLTKFDILVSAHSSNVYNRNFATYYFEKTRYLKIEGIYI